MEAESAGTRAAAEDQCTGHRKPGESGRTRHGEFDTVVRRQGSFSGNFNLISGASERVFSCAGKDFLSPGEKVGEGAGGVCGTRRNVVAWKLIS